MDLKSNNKLVLVGFMGTGKSTVSRQLSHKLNWERVDVDEEIEHVENRRIPDIFSQDGEAAFRAIESKVLAQLLQSKQPAIIATGGGAVLSEHNRELMLDSGYVVALKASPEHIIARVQSDTSRPLLQGDAASKVYQLLEQRKHAYDFAHTTIDTSSLAAEEVVALIIEQMNKQKMNIS